ncbi:exosortase-associated protein EpsI, V-type [Sphingomonas tabacisoli]|uniref:Exosortase-associated protein EpsI, V-type n=1 Tax=Sphingomonas tabacisoli TaxID=2249466 RepID=A0ABW4HZU3_9SPHN
MINRRDLLIGGACFAAAAGAEVLRPHKRVALLGKEKLEDVIPKTFGVWHERDAEGIVTPQSEDSLAARLYNQSVGRMYSGPGNSTVMLLIAYGNTQSDTLQLHRPEVCYPAFGFTITKNQPTALAMSGGAVVRARNLVAATPGREERITYWTRLGEFLPTNNSEQRQMKFRTALAGIIPDGVLVRISNTELDDRAGFELNARFAADLLKAVPPAVRPALITTEQARLLTGAAQV